jgi:hypothetical protein
MRQAASVLDDQNFSLGKRPPRLGGQRHARHKRDFLIMLNGLDRDTRLWQCVDVHQAAALQLPQAGRRNDIIRLYAPVRVCK